MAERVPAPAEVCCTDERRTRDIVGAIGTANAILIAFSWPSCSAPSACAAPSTHQGHHEVGKVEGSGSCQAGYPESQKSIFNRPR